MDSPTIPYHFDSRTYQEPFIRAVTRSIRNESPIRYFMQVWHRRSGKDKVDIADCAPRRLIQDPCLVKFVYPTLTMGRDNLWNGIGGDGFRYKEHIPSGLRAGEPNETRMEIPIYTKHNEVSLFQVGGSDHPDSLRGGNPKMFIFSEWSEQDPYAWDVVEPILKENNGIALFNFTPKGDNHARGMYEYARNNPLWYVELLTAEDTGIWNLTQLDAIRQDIIKRFAAQGRSESEANSYFEQEYMCSFKSPVIGSYYGEGINRAEKEHRIGHVPYVDSIPVETAWDLGYDDSMTIWFFQTIAQEIHLIDYYENSGEGLPHYAQVLQGKRYLYGRHFAPHDIAVHELGTGKSRIETARSLGIKFEIGARLDPEDGIDAARSLLSQCWFDREKTMRGLNALKNYHKDWDEKNKVFRNNPKHDWSSHGADAFRTFAVGYKKRIVYQPQTTFGGVKPFFPKLGI